MKDGYLKFAPYILVSVGLAVWGISYYLSNIFPAHEGFTWLPFILSQVFANFFCGIFIKKLYEQASKDSLTGACNRRYFAAKVSTLSKMKFPVSLMMVDIDNFKKVNDVYGHLAGDELLKQVAEILYNNVRKTDLVARWGGEEFTIVLPNTSPENAFKLAERIKNIVETNTFDIGMSKVSMTISIGIATTTFPIHPDCFVDFADKALYKAKETKNAVVAYGQIENTTA